MATSASTTTTTSKPQPTQVEMQTSQPPRGPVTATLNFYAPPPDNSAPFNHVDTPPAGLPQRNFSDSPKQVTISDVRDSGASSFTLDNDAFAVLQNQPPSSSTIDFTSNSSIEETYYPEIESLLLKHVPGSNKVIIFDHTIRRQDPSAPRSPVQRVHIDQTAVSAAVRVRRHASSEAEAEDLLANTRYRIINVWRTLNKDPLESFPLAFASSSTLSDDDIVPVQHRYNSGFVGQTAAIKYNPGQKWYYISGITSDERILLECFDSDSLKGGSQVKGGRVAHTAFADPRTRPDAEGRESIEVRALVFGP
ncbi:putative 7alpha-cephem-methoxylase p8 chain related protein [Rhypophila decipiens]|uniref:7alpha-cephem-methoxylase p8 chain related protein n=1 Tax=Rhypophila decipiens TaxID=261697 RepID=A0AAN6Y8C9_9PEZI|nr:putative 7alpha-cephem-methoxylase p8 chain related protein [Rhypophila decipiens]